MSLSTQRRLPDGRVSIGRRQLSDEERKHLKARYEKRRRIRFGASVVMLLFMGSVYLKLLSTTGEDRFSWSFVFLWVVLVATGIVGVGLLVLVAFNRIFRVDVVRLSTRATEAERFRYPVDTTEERTTEVLSQSLEVLNHDGRRVLDAKQILILRRGVAPPSVTFAGGIRPLSPEEIGEIEAIVEFTHRRVRRGFAFLFGSLVLLMGIFFAFPPSREPGALMRWGAGGLSAFLLGGALIEYFSAYRLQLDAGNGKVRDAGRQERLIHSRFAWTVDGEPASWRSYRLPPP